MSEVLSPSDLSAIEAAVREAETRTTGEIYCVVAEASSDYRETPLAWAAGVAILAPALLLLVGGVRLRVSDIFTAGWTAGQTAEAALSAALVETLILQGLLFALTFAIVAIPPVRRLLTLRGLKRDQVRLRAYEQFAAKNLHATRDRTGVLIYVSLREHMAELIADQGIAEYVEPAVWERAMAALVAGLKRGEPAAGFAAAVGLCADVLAERFPPRPGDNPNELPDAVVMISRA